MSFTKTFHAKSGHTLFVKKISFDELPEDIKNSNGKLYTDFYVVKNWDDNGVVFMYVGKGYEYSPKEYVIWYGKHCAFCSGFGNTIEDAINKAQEDGWLYA